MRRATPERRRSTFDLGVELTRTVAGGCRRDEDTFEPRFGRVDAPAEALPALGASAAEAFGRGGIPGARGVFGLEREELRALARAVSPRFARRS
ncbi:MAG TPA: hypothetical protein VM694_21615 [Polyangium sp.]|nr:hypothetical protein [Polyangium sp.]